MMTRRYTTRVEITHNSHLGRALKGLQWNGENKQSWFIQSRLHNVFHSIRRNG
jgi:hypothetical protein